MGINRFMICNIYVYIIYYIIEQIHTHTSTCEATVLRTCYTVLCHPDVATTKTNMVKLKAGNSIQQKRDRQFPKQKHV